MSPEAYSKIEGYIAEVEKELERKERKRAACFLTLFIAICVAGAIAMLLSDAILARMLGAAMIVSIGIFTMTAICQWIFNHMEGK